MSIVVMVQKYKNKNKVVLDISIHIIYQLQEHPSPHPQGPCYSTPNRQSNAKTEYMSLMNINMPKYQAYVILSPIKKKNKLQIKQSMSNKQY